MVNKLTKNSIGGLLVLTLLLPTSGCNNTVSKPANPNEKLVRDYYAAYEKKDSVMLNSLFAEGFVFLSPNDDHIDLKTYYERCWPNCVNIKRFDLEKLIVDGDDAFVTYNGWTNDGRVFRNTEYFKFKDGKIKENACYFGPGISYPNNPNAAKP
jgi:ketosteroid isomerase-like protein